VAVLGEGPESRIPGRASVRLRARPVHVLKGLVFVWAGTGEPAPIEQDVPPEFFQPESLIFAELRTWECNWRPTVENYSDAHVYYVHRNSLLVLTMPWSRLRAVVPGSAEWPRPTALPSGSLVVTAAGQPPEPQTRSSSRVRRRYPSLGITWPRSDLRYHFARVLDAVHWRQPRPSPHAGGPEWSFMRLPGILRAPFPRYVYTRTVVPVDETTTRIVYCHTRRPRGRIDRAWYTVLYHGFYRWYSNRNFSGQDGKVLRAQDYGAREHLSVSDSVTVAWRHLVLTYARRPEQIGRRP
jgi:phenylpropionate dioxygenase-like ring-hydroxylating dioxygenase large terminal subunit